MAELHRRISAILHRAPLLCALALLPLLSGCEMLEKFTQSKTTNPVVPEPPVRKDVADSKVTGKKPTSAPVKLNGSGAPDGPAVIPALPGFDNVPLPDSASKTGPRAAKRGAADDAGTVAGGGSADDSTGDNTGIAAAGDNSSGTSRKPVPKSTNGTKPSAKSPEIELLQHEEPIDEAALDAAGDSAADVISPIEIEGSGKKFQKGEIAALVNGAPIFSEDVLRSLPEELSQRLIQAEKGVAEGQLKPEEFRMFRRLLIDKFIQQHIDQELMLQEVKRKLKDEQLAGITKQLDAAFNSEGLPAALKRAGVATTHELEVKLQKEGSSIDALRMSFRNKQLAQQYLGLKAMVNTGFDRPDIRKYYDEHKADYAITAKAKWEQIQLKFDKQGGKEKAKKKAEEILERLDAGEIFAVVAKECSNGSTAEKGGLWDWTTQASIKSKEIDQALFEQPVKEISFPIETEESYEIIRVIDRTRAGYQPFEDVQEDIKSHLKNVLFQKRVGELVKELNAKATIEKFTDKL